jgi:hypothetical protein
MRRNFTAEPDPVRTAATGELHLYITPKPDAAEGRFSGRVCVMPEAAGRPGGGTFRFAVHGMVSVYRFTFEDIVRHQTAVEALREDEDSC